MKIILLQTAKCTWLCAVICLTMLACQSMSHPEVFSERGLSPRISPTFDGGAIGLASGRNGGKLMVANCGTIPNDVLAEKSRGPDSWSHIVVTSSAKDQKVIARAGCGGLLTRQPAGVDQSIREW
jgi:hypothetical protein